MSMGAGVQTTAMLLKWPERYDYIIFADTGDEKKETLWYVETYLKPFCKEHNLKWVTVRHKDGFSLMSWCIHRRILPIKSRRWCTSDFKIKPINRYLRKLGATKKNPIHVDIGFSIDESHRVNFSKKDVLYVVKEYPLLDAKLSRKDCYKIITDYGWPIPEKSGCDFCMFNKRSHFRKLQLDQPERFHKIVMMEQNDRFYPRKPLTGKYLLESIEQNGSLDNFLEDENESCDSGHCFV